MKKAKTSVALGSLFTLSALMCTAQTIMEFRDIRRFRQINPEESVFEGGELSVQLEDGSIQTLPCTNNGSLLFQVANFANCPTGTTTFVTNGDLDGDGNSDNLAYFATTLPIRAQLVRPSASSVIEVTAAPPAPSDRDRFDGSFWVDRSVNVVFNLIGGGDFSNFDLTRYELERGYNFNELGRQRDEVVPGRYIFSFPAIVPESAPPRTTALQVNHLPMLEAFPGAASFNTNNNFRFANDDAWRNDAIEIDPTLPFTFNFEGLNGTTFIPGDRLFFQIRNRASNLVSFPPFPANLVVGAIFGNIFNGPVQTPILIGGGQLGFPRSSFALSPGLIPAGNEEVVIITHTRNAGSTAISVDRSTRTFTANFNTIETFEGFAINNLNTSTPNLIAPGFDFDGDGFTNLEEFALLTDPVDPSSVPNITVETDPFTEQCVLTIPKRTTVGGSLSYQVEYTEDFETFITVPPLGDFSDDNWLTEQDNDNVLIVRSADSAISAPCNVRIRITQL